MSVGIGSHEIRVPTIGESVVETTVARWLKNEGDSVSQGEPVVEIESEKASMEVPADTSGILERILKQRGETARVGEALAIIRAAAPGEPAGPPSAATAREPAPPEIETPPERPTPAVKAREEGRATPIAMKTAERYGIDIAGVRGTGPHGRITREDVEAHVKDLVSAGPASRAEAPPPPASGAPPRGEAQAPTTLPPTEPKPPMAAEAPAQAPPEPSADRYEERVRLSRRLLTMARRMAEANQTAAMATTYNEADMSRIMELRKQHRPAFKERHGADLGLMSFFVKATVHALRAFPRLNAELQGEELVLKHYYDIGVAVGMEEGLVVPVLRDADRLTFAEIEEAIAGMAQRARERKLTLDELTGGTFTITNGGIFGSLWSTPILNLPQTGILGMHRIEERPIVREGQVVARPMMYLAVTYDHRIVDGREAVLFLVRLKEFIEDPSRLLLAT